MSKILGQARFWIRVGLALMISLITLIAALSLDDSGNTSTSSVIAGNLPDNTSSVFMIDSSVDASRSLTPLAGGALGSANVPENRLPLAPIPITINYTTPMSGIVGLFIDANLSDFTDACTLWSVFSNDGETKMCYGSPDCCRFAGQEPKWSQWNTALYLTRGANGVEESNLVTVQLLASTGNLISNYQESDIQRISVVISNTTDMAGSSVQLVSGIQQATGVYMELSEPGTVVPGYNVSLEVGNLSQGETQIGVPVDWHQQIKLTNNEQQEINYSLNLWDLSSSIGIDFLNDVRDFQMSSEGTIISETAVAVLDLTPGEEETIDVLYLTPPVMMDKNCTVLTLSQLLPEGAVVVENELPLDTPVREICSIRLYHSTVTHYRNIYVNLSEIDPNPIESIYYVEGATYLTPTNNSVDVPAVADS